MRSREVAFRLRQEFANLALYLKPPRLSGIAPPSPLPSLPRPETVAASLRGTGFERELLALAESILANRLPLLGHAAVEYGPRIFWRRDPLSGIESKLRYLRRIPYLDVKQVGDQKLVWELNRHAHLTVLAQAWVFTRDARYTARLFEQLEDWWRENPFQQGMNWTAALEVAFRALSWTWAYHLAGDAMPAAFRARFLTELYRHGCHLTANLSVYSSPNTHLLGEAVALHALGALFPVFPQAAEWRAEGAAIVQSHMDSHVLADGMYFEQSTYYHVYALDMFLFHAALETTPPRYRERLQRMAELTRQLAGPGRRLPFLGDDDGGRLFHPYGERSEFCRGSLAACERFLQIDLGSAPEDHAAIAAWWFAPAATLEPASPLTSRHFAGSGLVSIAAGSAQVLVDAGPFGAGTAGHSHSDSLSLVARDGEQELLIDPGTYCYLSDPVSREHFRSASAHNTLSVDGHSQAFPVNPFRWNAPPQMSLAAWSAGGQFDWLDASCHYRQFSHRRRVLFLRDLQLLCVLDEMAGSGDHTVEQCWHTTIGIPCDRFLQIGKARLLSAAASGRIDYPETWYAPAFGTRRAGRSMRVRQQGALPMVFGTVLDFNGRHDAVELVRRKDEWSFELAGGVHIPMSASARIESPVRK